MRGIWKNSVVNYQHGKIKRTEIFLLRDWENSVVNSVVSTWEGL
jgi:hypothetical protein